jgi:Mrp family chromosome partitioning ATPase
VSFAEGLVVRALRGAAAFAAFFAFGRHAPELFEASGTVVVDGRAPIVVSAWDHELARAQGARDAALARVSELAARVGAAAAPAPSGSPLDRLIDFVALHPELPKALAEQPPPARTTDPETERIRLERERQSIQASLAAGARRGPAPQPSEAGDDSDNPFGAARGAPPVDDRRLKLRLAEIDASLTALAKAPAAPAAPGLRSELALLAVAIPPSGATSGEPALRRANVATARGDVVAREPERPALFGIGLAVALAVALLPVARRSRRDDELDEIVPGASLGLAPSPVPTFEADEIGPEAPPVRSLPSAAVESTAYPPPTRTSSAPPPAAAAIYDEPVVASARPRSSPPTGESPVMAYPVPWRAESVVGRDRFSDLRKAFLTEAARDCFVVAVTATATAAGRRAEVTAALAAAFASDPTSRVLAVEADLRAPELGRALRLDVLAVTDFGAQLAARVEGTADGHWYVLKCSPALHVLAAREQAPELLLSTHFEDCMVALRPFYDVILLSAPAVTDVPGCRAVADVVDGVVVLVSASQHSDVQAGGSALSLFGQKRLAVELRV